MTDRPILFSGPMVRAILDGTKSQTRRIAKFVQPNGSDWHIRNGYGGMSVAHEHAVRECGPDYAPYAIGDRLWVRETWRTHIGWDNLKPSEVAPNSRIWWEADGRDNCAQYGKTRVSIFMPRWASRLTLTVTDVRVERLQHISEADAIAEGIVVPQPRQMLMFGMNAEERAAYRHRLAVDAYRTLWNHINGPEAWDANPWVCAVSFSAEQRNIDQ